MDTEDYQPTDTPVHDYRKDKRGWGWDYSFKRSIDGLELDAWGHGNGLKLGDILVFTTSDADVGSYSIEEIRYAHDPSDMWFARLQYAHGACEELPNGTLRFHGVIAKEQDNGT